MMSIRARSEVTLVACAALVSSLLAPAAWGTVVAGYARGLGITSSVDLGGSLSLVVPATATALGTAPDPFTQGASAASVNVSALALANVGTAALESSAQSNVNGSVGLRSSQGTADVDNVLIRVGLGLPIAPDLVNVSATNMFALARVQGDYGDLVTSYQLRLDSLSVRVQGIPVVIDAHAAPNTIAFDRDGVQIIVNEQTLGGDGRSGRSLSVTALRIRFVNAPLGTRVLNGDIMVGLATCGLAAVSPGCAGGCFADFNGSGGTPDTSDITAFFTAWLAGDSSADTDCSAGTPDGSDISVFLNQWLAGGC